MDIVCPQLKPGSIEQQNIEYFRVYLVTKEQLETCRVKGDMALLNCDKPDQDVKFTFKFQEFRPHLWSLEFLKGKDYDIIYSVKMGRREGRVGNLWGLLDQKWPCLLEWNLVLSSIIIIALVALLHRHHQKHSLDNSALDN